MKDNQWLRNRLQLRAVLGHEVYKRLVELAKEANGIPIQETGAKWFKTWQSSGRLPARSATYLALANKPIANAEESQMLKKIKLVASERSIVAY
ncbi:hypothetical protein T231_01920 [Tannerella sp. oral taxon BU063 isolate Cell 6/7/9]|uniref:Uncharacterized protein n=2 Tax=Tannerella serpentiformis TaxID=712710 RepID=W2CTP4_9BACT|nr:hypothetical protein T230_03870 [Tannerella sp. oral taxon BU063 isolate Cell 1/3]ETK10955.1 hypothetical protein T231_01920 [Tannerella sp. oral taxon BU063 isolate Cell 6/7/9]